MPEADIHESDGNTLAPPCLSTLGVCRAFGVGHSPCSRTVSWPNLKRIPPALPEWYWKFESSGSIFSLDLSGLCRRCMQCEALAFVLAFAFTGLVPQPIHLFIEASPNFLGFRRPGYACQFRRVPLSVSSTLVPYVQRLRRGVPFLSLGQGDRGWLIRDEKYQERPTYVPQK